MEDLKGGGLLLPVVQAGGSDWCQSTLKWELVGEYVDVDFIAIHDPVCMKFDLFPFDHADCCLCQW